MQAFKPFPTLEALLCNTHRIGVGIPSPTAHTAVLLTPVFVAAVLGHWRACLQRLDMKDNVSPQGLLSSFQLAGANSAWGLLQVLRQGQLRSAATRQACQVSLKSSFRGTRITVLVLQVEVGSIKVTLKAVLLRSGRPLRSFRNVPRRVKSSSSGTNAIMRNSR